MLLCFIKLILGITDPVLPGEPRSTHPQFGIAEFLTRDPNSEGDSMSLPEVPFRLKGKPERKQDPEISEKLLCHGHGSTVGLECFST